MRGPDIWHSGGETVRVGIKRWPLLPTQVGVAKGDGKGEGVRLVTVQGQCGGGGSVVVEGEFGGRGV